jgi:3-(3-hydroxy-phenyl)propionate hydroxylase
MSGVGPILIAGGGPVGVVAALALARAGLEVHLFEADHRVNEAPRAASTHASTLEMLSDLGLANEVLRQGSRQRRFNSRNGRHANSLQSSIMSRSRMTRAPFVVQLEQHKLANVAMEGLRSLPNASLHMSARVRCLELSVDRVQIEVEGSGTTKTVTGSYLIGADGGRSTVRKQLGIAFDSLTFPQRFPGVTTSLDFAATLDCAFRNFFFDPEEWVNLFKVRGGDDCGAWAWYSKKRLEERDANARQEHFAFLRTTAADPKAHRAFLLRASLLESVRDNVIV